MSTTSADDPTAKVLALIDRKLAQMVIRWWERDILEVGPPFKRGKAELAKALAVKRC